MNDASLDDAMTLHAELFARYMEGHLPPKLAVELEAVQGDLPDFELMQEMAHMAMAAEDAAAADDWPQRMRDITGEEFHDSDWLPFPMLDNLETQRQAAADRASRYVVDEFPLENGYFMLFWQGETLFLHLTSTDDFLWRATAQALLLSPVPVGNAATTVQARAELVLESNEAGEYQCTVPLPVTGELSARSQLFVSVFQPAPTFKSLIKEMEGKLRVGHASVPREPMQTAGSRIVNVNAEEAPGHLRLLIDEAGIRCELYWDNQRARVLLRAQLTAEELVGQELQFTLMVKSKILDASALVLKTHHVFSVPDETFEHTFALEAYSTGGADFAFQVGIRSS